MTRARAIHLLLLPLGAAAISGCEDLAFRPGAESLLEVTAGPTPAEAAAMSINPYDANDRYRGTILLANASFANQPVYIRLFEDNARDPDAAVRAAAMRGLANHGDPSHVPILVKALSDIEPLVRLEAARGLQRLHDPQAVEALIRATDENAEPETDVRSAAADALGQYAQSRVLQALVAALSDKQLAVNARALASLRTLTGQDFGWDRRAWLDWIDKTKEPFAARSVYLYPAFNRPKKLIEYLPLIPNPPNETPAPPAGMPLGEGPG